MVAMDNPEVPPAIHLRMEQEADRGYSDGPIGELSVTVSAGLVDDFLNRPAALVRSSPVADEDSISSAGLVDDFLNRPALLVFHARDNA